MKKLLKLLYIDLLLPVLCLYVLPVIRLEVNETVKDSLVYTSAEVFLILSSFACGLLLAGLVFMCLDKKEATENMIFLIIGIASAGGAIFLTMGKILPNFYSLPYAAAYLGACVFLLISNIRISVQNK